MALILKRIAVKSERCNCFSAVRQYLLAVLCHFGKVGAAQLHVPVKLKGLKAVLHILGELLLVFLRPAQ